MKNRKDTFDIDDEEYLEEYYIRPDEVEDYDDEEDESVHNLVIDTSRFNQPDDKSEESVLNSQKDPFNGIDDVVFEDGCLIPDDDVEDYNITDFLIF
jgi:hypothetical protein